MADRRRQLDRTAVIAFGDNGVRRADLAAVARVAAGAPELLQGRTAFIRPGLPDDGRQPSSRPGFSPPIVRLRAVGVACTDSDQQSSEGSTPAVNR